MNADRWTRRDLMGRATVAAAAGTALGWIGAVRAARAQGANEAGGGAAPGAAPANASALRSGSPVPLAYEALPGFLSKDQLAIHHQKHYGGALKALTALEGRVYGEAGVTDAAARRELGRAQSEKANSVLLHELYFAGMAAKPPEPGVELRTALASRFGSLDRWRADLEACALAANGWAMLAVHPVNGRLYHVLSDAHDVGPLWIARPLAIIDTYEHAYYVDYRNDRAAYVKGWFDRIDWAEAERRWVASR
jgi:Fe-Mn family superoxide dismutase